MALHYTNPRLPPWKQLIPTYIEWRDEVDQDGCLDQFDLALGWFSGKGYSHDDALEAAKFMWDYGKDGAMGGA